MQIFWQKGPIRIRVHNTAAFILRLTWCLWRFSSSKTTWTRKFANYTDFLPKRSGPSPDPGPDFYQRCPYLYLGPTFSKTEVLTVAQSCISSSYSFRPRPPLLFEIPHSYFLLATYLPNKLRPQISKNTDLIHKSYTVPLLCFQVVSSILIAFKILILSSSIQGTVPLHYCSLPPSHDTLEKFSHNFL